jgi:hypothetical protein
MNLIDLDKITIGSDPEFFIVDKKGDAFPSIGIFNGTKESPEDQGGGFALLKDNVLVEGNIPPANNVDEFVASMKTLKSMMNSVLAVAGLQLHSADSMKYKPRFLEHPEANIFGCSAYKNAWELGSFSAENMSFMPIRVAGHHHHVGYFLTENCQLTQKQMNRYIAKAFDYFVVYPARQHYNDEFRAKYYGNYGVYRDCPAYGLEARALGGHFTADEHLEWTYKQTIKAVEYCSNSENLVLLNACKAPITEDLEATLVFYKALGIDLNEQLIKEDGGSVSITRDCKVSETQGV